jgi:hypothetical protein
MKDVIIISYELLETVHQMLDDTQNINDLLFIRHMFSYPFPYDNIQFEALFTSYTLFSSLHLSLIEDTRQFSSICNRLFFRPTTSRCRIS